MKPHKGKRFLMIASPSGGYHNSQNYGEIKFEIEAARIEADRGGCFCIAASRESGAETLVLISLMNI